METNNATTNADQKPTWADAAAASAAIEAERKREDKAPRLFTEKMPCKLSEKDICEIAGQIAEADEEACAIEDERKAANDGFKARIQLAEQRRTELIAKVRSKVDTRDVDLVEEFIFATNTVEVRRVDTKELVRKRAMTPGERQAELPLPEPKSETPAVAKTDSDTPTEPAPPDGSEITDPQATLDGDVPPEGEKPLKKVKRVKRSES